MVFNYSALILGTFASTLKMYATFLANFQMTSTLFYFDLIIIQLPHCDFYTWENSHLHNLALILPYFILLTIFYSASLGDQVTF